MPPVVEQPMPAHPTRLWTPPDVTSARRGSESEASMDEGEAMEGMEGEQRDEQGRQRGGDIDMDAQQSRTPTPTPTTTTISSAPRLPSAPPQSTSSNTSKSPETSNSNASDSDTAYLPPDLRGVPIKYIIDKLHELGHRYWRKEDGVNLTLLVPMPRPGWESLAVPSPTPPHLHQPQAHYPPGPYPYHPPPHGHPPPQQQQSPYPPYPPYGAYYPPPYAYGYQWPPSQHGGGREREREYEYDYYGRGYEGGQQHPHPSQQPPTPSPQQSGSSYPMRTDYPLSPPPPRRESAPAIYQTPSTSGSSYPLRMERRNTPSPPPTARSNPSPNNPSSYPLRPITASYSRGSPPPAASSKHNPGQSAYPLRPDPPPPSNYPLRPEYQPGHPPRGEYDYGAYPPPPPPPHGYGYPAPQGHGPPPPGRWNPQTGWTGYGGQPPEGDVRRGSLPTTALEAEESVPYKLHKDYLLTQSTTLRALLHAPPHTDILAHFPFPLAPSKRPRLHPSSTPSHPIITLPVPDPFSLPHILHYFYFGASSYPQIESMLDAQEITWGGLVRNSEWLGVPTDLKEFLGGYWRRKIRPQVEEDGGLKSLRPSPRVGEGEGERERRASESAVSYRPPPPQHQHQQQLPAGSRGDAASGGAAMVDWQ